MKEPLLERIERKLSRFAPKNLMLIIIIGTAAVWLLDYIVSIRSSMSIIGWLYFDLDAILQGQVWRIITFVFVPEASHPVLLALSLYFYWLIGNSMENEWGSFRFDAYYFCGVLGAIISGVITGFATNTYLNLSLFLAFAILYPNFKVYVFFFLPVKMKWLAIIDAVLLVISLILGGWVERIAILLSVLNLFLFVWRIPFDKIRAAHRRRKWKREAKIRDHNDYPFDL